jgi:predicted nucleic acid-binding protein
MIQYALDTNIVSYYLKGNARIIEKVNLETRNGNTIIIPPLVFFEIRRWLLANNASRKSALFETMLAYSGIGIVDRAMLDTAAEIYVTLRKKGITLEDNDLLIGTYCIEHNLTLVTNNVKHFKDMPHLQVQNWIEDGI